MIVKSNISDVAAKKLCNTCGGCYGICPSRAIQYVETTGGYYLPKVNELKCTHCGLCTEICPGIYFGSTLLEKMPTDPFTGIALNTYIGKAVNRKLFSNAQSGGVVSAILDRALENGFIKSAITVSMKPGIPPRPFVNVSKNIQEIIKGQKSKYSPVPLLVFLRKLKTEDCPIAVVGTSCHIHGLRNILDKIPKFRNSILFTVGLICDRVLTYAAIDYLIAKSKIDRNFDAILHFRDKSVSGYPGDVHVIPVNGKSVVIPSNFRIEIKNYFTPARCRICFDKMNVFSDITVGDPHGISCIDKKLGETAFLVRTELGMNIVQSAFRDKAINFRPIPYDLVLRGQGIDIKRKQWRGFLEAWEVYGNILPNYSEIVKLHAPLPTNIKGYIRDIKYSLMLDKFSSRQKLLCFVDNTLRRKRFIDTFRFPVSATKRGIKKICHYFKTF